MKILALEFSSAHRRVAVVELDTHAGSCSLAKLAEQPQPVRVAEVVQVGQTNSMQPFQMIQDALYQAGLERSQLDCVAVGLGPGSYTGIRAAIAIAQGWQLASNVRLAGVSSAAAIAAGAWERGLRGTCSVLIDAQRNEFYIATYLIDAAGAQELEPLRLASSDEVMRLAATGRVLIGPDITARVATVQAFYPSAIWIARLTAARAEFVSGEKLEPIYLREARFVKAPPPKLYIDTA